MDNQIDHPENSIPTSQNPSTQPLPIPSVSRLPRQNYLRIVILFLLISLTAVGGLAVYFWQRTKTASSIISELTPSQQPISSAADETVNWKTYQDNNTPYAIKYPPGMIVSGAEAWISFSISNAGPFLNYKFVGNKDNKTLDQFIDSYVETNNDPDQPIVQFKSKTPITINEVPGYKAQTSNTMYFFLKHPSTPAVAVFTYLLNIDQQSQNTFDQILSTFKFTDKSIATLPVGWSTHQSTKCKVSFPFPPKKEPYLVPGDARTSGVNDAGAYWQFYEEPTSSQPLFDKGFAEVIHKQDYAASGYVGGSVEINCAPNDVGYTNASLSDKLIQMYPKSASSGSVQDLGNITITFKADTTMWGRIVKVANFEGGMYGDENYYIFATPNYIYMVRKVVMSSLESIQNTSEQILENLQFES